MTCVVTCFHAVKRLAVLKREQRMSRAAVALQVSEGGRGGGGSGFRGGLEGGLSGCCPAWGVSGAPL